MLTNDRSLRIAVWIIALSLAAIALRPIVNIKDAQAESPIEKFFGLDQGQPKDTPTSEQLGGSASSGRIVPFGIQGNGAFWAYDRETLGIYIYDVKDGRSYYLGKISQLGRPMNQTGVTAIPSIR